MFRRRRSVSSVQVHQDGSARASEGLATAFLQGRYDDLEEHLKEVRSDDLPIVLRHLTQRPAQEWCEARPQSALAWALLGSQLLAQARHEARRSPTSSSVDKIRILGAQAIDALGEARGLAPTNPLPAALSMGADGLGVFPRDHVKRLYSEAALLEPTHFKANEAMARSSQARWGGTHELSIAFGRDALSLPAGTPASGLPMVEAHLEKWFDSMAVTEPSPDPSAYFTQEVQQELRTAAERSVLHPRAEASWARVRTLNAFAFCADVAGDEDLLHDTLAAVRGHFTPRPWYYRSDPVRAFQSAHLLGGVNPGRRR